MPKFALPIDDPVLIFAVVMVILLVAPLLAAKARLPGIIGLIVAGILVGPHAFGILERDKTIELLGTVGLLYIMFLAGLEIDLFQVKRHRSHSIVFGVLTFLIPLLLGFLGAHFIIGFGIAESILLASMFSSHTLLTFPIVSGFGLAKNRAVIAAVGGTIITDTLAMVVLAVIAGSTHGTTDAVFFIRLGGFLVVYVLVVILFLPRIGRWFFKHFAGDGVIEFVFVIAVLFICAYLAHLAGLEPIIGAFLAGLTLNILIPEKSALMNRIQFVGNSLFIPFFLISVGMLVDIGKLVSGTGAWIVSTFMAVTVFVAKWFAAEGTRFLLKFTRNEGYLIFGMSVNQAAATLAAVLVGYRLQLFDESVLTGSIIMIVLTCLFGPLITERFGRKVALQEEKTPLHMTELPERIMIAVSNRETLGGLVEFASFLRLKGSTEPLYPLYVARDGIDADQQVAYAEKMLAHAMAKAIDADVPAVPVTRLEMDIPTGILRSMKELRISQLVLGSNEVFGFQRHLFSQIMGKVLAGSNQLIMECRIEKPLNIVKRVLILLPPLIERQPGILRVFRSAKTVASQTSAKMLLVGTEKTFQTVRTSFETMKPHAEVAYHTVSGLQNAALTLKTLTATYDLLFLVTVRKGRLAWQPQLERLQKHLTEEYPDHSIVIAYPPETASISDTDIQSEGDARILMKKTSFSLGLTGLSVRQALEKMLIPLFMGRESTALELAEVLERISREDPVRLTEHTVLLHTNSELVHETVVSAGVNKHGFSLPKLPEPIRIVFVLIDPLGAEPELHLSTLAQIARFFQKEGAEETLLRASSADELDNLF